MDQPGLKVGEHEKALRGLERINTLSLAATRIWRRVEVLYEKKEAPLRLLDVACGGGDVAVAIKRRAEKSGMPIEVEGCDVSSTALDYATAKARAAGLPVRFFEHDVIDGRLPCRYDLVCSSLFLHHLSDAQAINFLKQLAGAGESMVVQDLVRSRIGYWLAAGAGRTLTRSKVVRVDALRSVRAAFSLSEVRQLTDAAGLAGARVSRCWPERFTIDWRQE
jgi:2-polyprenyl-3-methyl-5-hydroxy-6-metoxy-1,4-benzoquinol methylase